MTKSPEHYQRLSKLYQERNEAINSNLSQTYIPNGKAENFIKLVGSNKHFVNMFVGANGTSKTATGANLVANIVFGPQSDWFQYPLFQKWPYQKRGRIISDPTTIKEKIIPELKKWFPKNEAKNIPEAFYETAKEGKNYESKIKTGNGWEIDIMSNEQDVKEFESVDLGFVWIDEPMPKDRYMATLARGRMGMTLFWTFTPLTYSAWIKDWLDENIGELAQSVEAEMEDNCFDKNTEILTKDGWKLFEHIGTHETVATYNTKDEVIEYQEINKRIIKYFKGELLDLNFDIGITPNHRMLVLPDRNFKDKSPKFKEARDLYRGLRMPAKSKNGKLEDEDFNAHFIIGDWCEFMGWYLSEGCTKGVSGGKEGNQIYISQNKGENREKIKRLLEGMGQEVHERKGDVWFTNKEFHKELLPLGNKYEKYIPRDMFRYPKDCLMRMWESLVLGDGDGKNRFVTTSERLANDVQELLLLCGHNASISKWKGRNSGFNKSESPRNQYCVRLNSKKYYYVNKIKKIRYDDKVYCVSVPNETIIVRNKDRKRPLITGNCKVHGIRGVFEHSHIKRIADAYPEDEKEARVFGKFGHLIGRVHKKFKRSIHVIRPFAINEQDWTTYKALDPHPRVPDHVLYLSVNKKGTKILTGEILSEGTPRLLFERMKAFEAAMHYRIEQRIIDPSAYNDDQHREEKSVGSQLYDMGESWIKGSKDLMAGIKRTDAALDYEIVAGKFIKPPELFIFDNLKVTIKQLEEYVWSDWKGRSADEKKPKGQPRDVNDHNVENLHRLLLAEPLFIPYALRRPSAMPSGYRIDGGTGGLEDFDPYQ